MKLNLGSGQRPFGKGWTNVDSQARFNPDVVMDAETYLKTMQSNSIEVICLHHVLEHFGCGEAIPLLKECCRVLFPDGRMLVFVPDMDAICRQWIRGLISTQVFMTNIYGAYMGDEADRHKWGYHKGTLIGLLYDAGFTHAFEIGKVDIEGADVAFDWWVLAMEATK